MSSGLNSLSAVVLVDIITPLRKEPFSDERAGLISKIIAASLGVVCILLIFVAANLGGVLQVVLYFCYQQSKSLTN